MDTRIFSISLAALALVAAGCVTPAADVAPAAHSAAPADAAPAAAPIAIAHDGRFGAGAFACAAVACHGVTAAPSQRLFETEAAGTVDVALEMTWAEPVERSHVLGVFTCAPSKCRSDADLTQIEYVYGRSPLVLDLSGFVVPEGETMTIFATPGPVASGPAAYVQVTAPLDLRIEGTIAPAQSGQA